VQGEHVRAPLIAECLGAIECRLTSHPVVGDHTIMVGEVLAGWAKPDAFSERLKVEEAQTLHHLGGREFCLPGEIITIDAS
jgi:flavin reductase (DIM6/NTAB) family NADH-FMN oxidoreductase RutF